MSCFEVYPGYKEAQTKWIDLIPFDWHTLSLKHLVEVRITDGPHETPVFVDSGVPFLSAEAVKNSRLDFSKQRGFISEQLHTEYRRKCLPKRDDVFMIKSGNTTGNVAIVETDLEFNIWSPLALIRADRTLMVPKFLYFSLLSDFFRKSVELSWSQGTQPNIGMGVIENLHVCKPTLKEQRKIANFLDHETAKIDTLIEKQQQLIKLLKEKRQAVISHAVTKGLNPDAPIKDSGVEWLGEVPAHWKQPKLGQVTLSKCDGPFGSGLKSEHYTDSGVLVVRLQNIKLGRYEKGVGAYIDQEYFEANLSNHDVVSGDLLIAGLGDPRNPVGRACVAPTDIEPALVKADCFRFRLDADKVVPEFIAAQLSVSSWVDAGQLSNGSTRARIPLNLMSTRRVAFGPLEEQEYTVKKIDEITIAYKKLVDDVGRAIGLLTERRTALISAAVTGKIDVRNWQPPESLLTPTKDA